MKSSFSTSRRQERSGTTRTRLLRAAEKIFARDGFEAAKLEEIAAEAGYTRGAFYANFSTKEDLFFALLEEEISSRIAGLEQLMQEYRESEAKLRAFREFFLSLSQDRRWSLLALEFKLFAVRHPEARARLAAMNRRLVRPRVGILEQVMKGSLSKLPASPTAVALSLSGASNAVALEHMLDRTAMPESSMKKILARYFDSLIGTDVTAESSGRMSPLSDKRPR